MPTPGSFYRNSRQRDCLSRGSQKLGSDSRAGFKAIQELGIEVVNPDGTASLKVTQGKVKFGTVGVQLIDQ